MLRLKKSLGQNFLVDKNVINKIVSLDVIKDKKIFEIGPGSGNLTNYIIQKKPKTILLIEKEKKSTLHIICTLKPTNILNQ